ncbi:MAG: preprotein translocase subunit SecG [Candidatus Harrisonbacteria bacterium]|nr:preprotein translocase subunit SecG [Candidatus Harrisonbacteria bacterium]
MLAIAQITVSIILIILILLQERSSGLSGILGGGEGEGRFYQTRRGLEKFIFWSTIVLAALFALLALTDLII